MLAFQWRNPPAAGGGGGGSDPGAYAALPSTMAYVQAAPQSAVSPAQVVLPGHSSSAGFAIVAVLFVIGLAWGLR